MIKFKSIPARRGFVWATVGILWLAAVSIGLGTLAEYASQPGITQPAPSHWPTGSQVDLNERGATLVMFAHPRCPCTRASLGELEKIVARCQGEVTAWVVFFKPDGAENDWEHADLRSTAAAIPGVHVIDDRGGEEARRFHAGTSGETVLYSHLGNLLFSGGITFARGHFGDNAGRSAIEAYLGGGPSGCGQTPVFGCPLATPLQPKQDP